MGQVYGGGVIAGVVVVALIVGAAASVALGSTRTVADPVATPVAPATPSVVSVSLPLPADAVILDAGWDDNYCSFDDWETGYDGRLDFSERDAAEATDVFVGTVERVRRGRLPGTRPAAVADPTVATYVVRVEQTLKGTARGTVLVRHPEFSSIHCGDFIPENDILRGRKTALFMTVFEPEQGTYRLVDGAYGYEVLWDDDFRAQAVATVQALVGTPTP